MTADEMRRAGTLALVIRWAHLRDEWGDGHRLTVTVRLELTARGVNLPSLARAIDADGSRS